MIGERLKRWQGPAEDVPDERFDRMENVIRLLQFNLSAYRPRRMGLRDGRFSERAETWSMP